MRGAHEGATKMKLKAILRFAATLAFFAASAHADTTDYDELVSRFAPAEEDFIVDKVTHDNWLIDFPDTCLIRRRTTTFVSRDERLAVLNNVIEGANIGDITPESFAQGEGETLNGITLSCPDRRKCVSRIAADTVRDDNGVAGSHLVKRTSEDHMTLRLSPATYMTRLDLLKQIASACRSRGAL